MQTNSILIGERFHIMVIFSTYHTNYTNGEKTHLTMLLIVTRLTRRVLLVEQELFTLQEHLSSPPIFYWGSCYYYVYMFCRWLLVLLYFYFWPLWCLFFFDIRILIIPLVSSNSFSVNSSILLVSLFYFELCHQLINMF